MPHSVGKNTSGDNSQGSYTFSPIFFHDFSMTFPKPFTEFPGPKKLTKSCAGAYYIIYYIAYIINIYLYYRLCFTTGYKLLLYLLYYINYIKISLKRGCLWFIVTQLFVHLIFPSGGLKVQLQGLHESQS